MNLENERFFGMTEIGIRWGFMVIKLTITAAMVLFVWGYKNSFLALNRAQQQAVHDALEYNAWYFHTLEGIGIFLALIAIFSWLWDLDKEKLRKALDV